jgi:hypothetical protein
MAHSNSQDEITYPSLPQRDYNLLTASHWRLACASLPAPCHALPAICLLTHLDILVYAHLDSDVTIGGDEGTGLGSCEAGK